MKNIFLTLCLMIQLSALADTWQSEAFSSIYSKPQWQTIDLLKTKTTAELNYQN